MRSGRGSETRGREALAESADRRHGAGAVAVALASLVLAGCAAVLGWIGQGTFSVVETYGGLGGGWAQVLAVLAAGAGVVVGGMLVVVVSLLGRAVRAHWLVLAGVAFALVAAGAGAYLGSLEYSAASTRAEHARDEPVGAALVSFGRRLDPGPLVRQDGGWTLARSDGTCHVLVNVAPDEAVAQQIARAAAAAGWTRTDDGWLSPDGVAMRYDVTHRPDTMTVVELTGRATRP